MLSPKAPASVDDFGRGSAGSVDEREFLIEPGHVLQYARAVGDARLSAALPAPGTPVPPTFVMADLATEPRHMRPYAVGYLGVRPSSPATVVLLGRQSFEVERPVRVGDRLSIRDEWSEVQTKVGRSGGSLVLQDVLKRASDATGALVVTARTTLVETQRPTFTPSGGPAAALSAAADPSPASGADAVVTTLPRLTRTGVTQFCGANGDFSRLHTDEPYARSQGFPGVLAHGLMIMAAAIRDLTDRIGVEAVRAYDGRFLAPTLPGDALTAVVRRGAKNGRTDATVYEISVRNEGGVDVFAGTLRVGTA